MKKLFVTILAVTFGVAVAQAQDDTREQFMFGLKVGANYSNVYDTKGEQFNADPKFGFAGGAFVSVPIGKFLGIHPEVLFSQKGFSSTGTLLGADFKLTRSTNYLDIPIFLEIKPVELLTILVGPQYSFLMKQTDDFTSGSTNILLQKQAFDNENIRKNTLCFVGGLDINIKYIVIGVTAGVDALNNNGDGTSNTPRYKNMWYQATVGFRL